MDKQLSLLYKQIKKGDITAENAIAKINELKNIHSSTKQKKIVSEIYSFDEPYVKDHTVFNKHVLLGVTHASLAINAFFKIFPEESSGRINSLSFVKPIEVNTNQQVEVIVKPVNNVNGYDFSVFYRYLPKNKWQTTATGKIEKAKLRNKIVDIELIKKTCLKIADFDQIYTANSVIGIGECFRTVKQFYKEKEKALVRISIGESIKNDDHKYFLSPYISNIAFLVISQLLDKSYSKFEFIPFGIRDVYFQKIGKIENCWLLVKVAKRTEEIIIFDAEVINDDSQVIAQYFGCSLKRLRADPSELDRKNNSSYNIMQKKQVKKKSHRTITQKIDSTNQPENLSRQIEEYLENKLRKYLKNTSKQIDLEMNLMDIGLESSQLVMTAKEIEKETEIQLYPTLFFEYPNIKELTEFFIQEHNKSFSKLFMVKDSSKRINTCKKQVEVIHVKEKRDNIKDLIITENCNISDNDLKKINHNGIAIIGMNGVFAQARTLDQFWINLWDQKDLISEIPADHWDYRPWYDPNPEAFDKTYCKWGSFIKDVDQFDADFFNISPREAEWIDPQIRMLMQSIYATAENSGLINQLKGSDIGVFVGACFHDYADKIKEQNLPVDPYIGTGNSHTVISNRISFAFDFKGPSLTIDTACSSSLIALHYACNALKNQECNLAFVGGVNLLLSSWHYRYFSSIGALSPTGRCYTFDAAADGYIPGECIASILLKPLDKAILDGDTIYAIIKGSAAIHGGYTPSLTAPSVSGEENVISKAWKKSGINPETLSYIEAHGTGTKIGDPIEIRALKKAFRKYTKKKKFCAIGSAKANIGHTEGAAGIAGIIKVILQMKYQKIPAMPYFNVLNPYIELNNSPLFINTKGTEWKTNGGIPRRAGINSFGFSGSYAHVVLEEYISNRSKKVKKDYELKSPSQYIIPLSAKNNNQLQHVAENLSIFIKKNRHDDLNITDLCYTLQTARETLAIRMGIIVNTIDELSEKLDAFLSGQKDIEGLYLNKNKKSNLTANCGNERQNIEDLIKKSNYSKILEMWVNGVKFDWNILYNKEKPKRLSLPTYPFDKKRYWIPESKVRLQGNDNEGLYGKHKMHPLIHKNTSNLFEQKYSSTFNGNESFFGYNLVRKEKILQSSVFLEMARAAVALATGKLINEISNMYLHNMSWSNQLCISKKSKEINIGLSVLESRSNKITKIHYSIYTEHENGNNKLKIHADGNAVLQSSKIEDTVDLNGLRLKMNQGTLDGVKSYKMLEELGVNYNIKYKNIKKIYFGDKIALAKFSMDNTGDGIKYLLNPALLESAIQTSICFIERIKGKNKKNKSNNIMTNDRSLKPYFNYFLKELHILRPCCENMYCLTSYPRSQINSDKQKYIDVILCDENGNISVYIKELNIIRKKEIINEKLTEARYSVKMQEKEKNNDVSETQREFSRIELKKSLKKDIKNIIQEILKIETNQLDDDSTFTEFGFDSISLSEFARFISHQYEIDISPAIFFSESTLVKLTNYLFNEYQEKIEIVLGKMTQKEYKNENKKIERNNGYENIKSIKRSYRLYDRVPYFENDMSTREPISIIGISCKFPMANNIMEFWENIKNEKDCIKEIPEDRWDWRAIYGKSNGDVNKTNIKWGGFIDGIWDFDPSFFGISSEEAKFMDPQQRLLMTNIYSAVEDAGYSPESLSGTNTGIFIGIGPNGYYDQIEKENSIYEGYAATGIVPSIGPNRMSYFLNLRGPSEAIETACASSLIAIRRAVMSIRTNLCDTAIVGGINTIVTPFGHIAFNNAGMLSKDGRCKTFSPKANGFVRGEGIGILILKNLRKAERDGDHIYGLIRGSAENHNGRSNFLTAPNPNAQTELLETAYRDANIDPRTVTYIEVHGTGTEIGDTIEIESLKNAFKKLYKETEDTITTAKDENKNDIPRCGLGSVKTNIGHLELASGMASMIKVLLQLKYKKLVKSLYSEEVNPYISLEGSPFYIVKEMKEWKTLFNKAGNPLPKRAGISSFGFGGVNAHVILEEYIKKKNEEMMDKISTQLIIFSARSKKQLIAVVQQMKNFIMDNPDISLADFAYTLQVGRDQMKYRIALEVTSMNDLVEKMDKLLKSSELVSTKGIRFGKIEKDNIEIKSLLSGKAGEILVERFLVENDYDKLALFWTKGGDLNWVLLHKNRQVQRLSLPTYPFSQKSYRISQIDEKYIALKKQHNNHELHIENKLKKEKALNPSIVDVFNNTKIIPLDLDNIKNSHLFRNWFE